MRASWPRRARSLSPLPLGALTGVVLTLALLVSAARLGIALRPEAASGALPASGSLDYGRGPPGGFSALRPDFIRGVLGDVISIGGPSSGGDGGPARGVTPSSDGERVVQVHELTNDDLASAREIPSVPFTAKTRTTTATRESAEPADCASTGSTVWYRYAPRDDTALVAYTFGSDYALSLGVFSGGADRLREVSCDTDPGGNALVALTAKAGEAYFFQITAPVAGGDLVFSLDPHGTTSLVSRASNGEAANGGASWDVTISGDGRFVAFLSTATNLAPGVPQCDAQSPESLVLPGPCQQAYVHDRLSGRTELISRSPSGQPANAHVSSLFLSRSGRFLTFESSATNLDGSDPDDRWDLFVHDRALGRTEELPVSATEPVDRTRERYDNYFFASISDDGRYVAFNTPARELVPDDTNNDMDVFVHDRRTGVFERVSESSSGRQMDGRTRRTGILYPSISPDGRFVAFASDSPTLVDGDTNGLEDVFLHDRLTRTTERVSVSSSDEQANFGPTWVPGTPRTVMSDDGRYMVFCSSASNLTPDDTNNGPDVFVRDRVARTTIRIGTVQSSVERPGLGRLGSPSLYSISGDGRYVVFDTSAPNLAPGDDRDDYDVLLYDMRTATTVLVTLSPTGGERSGESPAVSADGRVVVYVGGAQATERHVSAYEAARAR